MKEKDATMPDGSLIEIPRAAPDPRVCGIILAGVHSWGGCELEALAVRPLLEVVGRPVVWHILDWLCGSGITSVAVCANSDTHALRAALGAGEPRDLALHYYEDVMPRGPAGCARDASLLCHAEDYVVCDGTILPAVDLIGLLAMHRRTAACLTVVASRPEGSGIEPAGLYVLARRALQYVPSRGYQDIKEVLIPALAAASEAVRLFEVPARACPRVTGIDSYLTVNLQAIEQALTQSQPPRGYHRVRESWIHHTADVAATARTIGPVWIGARSVVEDGAIIVGPAYVGHGTLVSRDAVVSCAVCGDGCTIGAASVVDHCVLAGASAVSGAAVLRHQVWRGRPGILARMRAAGRRGRQAAGVQAMKMSSTEDKSC
jgi:NDP-sugar pyrophosphorylase family protein